MMESTSAPAALVRGEEDRWPRARGVSRACALAALAIGAFVLGAWLVRPWLPSGFSFLWMMKANTALAVVATSIATLLLGSVGRNAPVRMRWALGALVVALALATLVEYATGWSPGLDQILARDPASELPGRMSPWTAALFAMLAATAAFHRSRLDRVADAASVGAGVVLQLVWAGYLYGVPALYAVGSSTLVSPQTLACASLLWVAQLAARLDTGFLGIVTRRSGGGELARTLLPVAWVLPLLLGWLRLSAQAEGLIRSTQMGVALLAVTQTLILVVLIYWLAHRIDGLEARYRQERERREDLERLVRMCSWTGQVRWQGQWMRVERFLRERFGLQVTHTISEEALQAYFPDAVAGSERER